MLYTDLATIRYNQFSGRLSSDVHALCQTDQTESTDQAMSVLGIKLGTGS